METRPTLCLPLALTARDRRRMTLRAFDLGLRSTYAAEIARLIAELPGDDWAPEVRATFRQAAGEIAADAENAVRLKADLRQVGRQVSRWLDRLPA